MNSKWYIGVLLIALAFLGICSEQTVVPNQEIVVQFNGDAVSATETESTIVSVTKQLQSIGVKGVKVVKTFDGNLKITYYSTIDVSAVKALFSNQEILELGYTSFYNKEGSSSEPFNNNTTSYELNVSEIQTASDTDMSGNGFLVELKSGNEIYFNPLLYAGNTTIDFSIQNKLGKVAYTLYEAAALGIDTASYKIPEVRAGPLPLKDA